MSRPADRDPRRGARWRCFVAIDLTEPARTAVGEYLRELRATVPGVGWARPDTLHLTLAFLGEVAVADLATLTARLERALAGTARFTAQVRGVGAFPSLARPQVLWVGVVAPPLLALADAVQSACAGGGMLRDPRPFRPHVTLGRVRTRSRAAGADLALLARDGDREFGTVSVDRVILYRSELGPGGARHSPVATFALAEP